MIQLVEVLSGRSLGRFNKRVTFRSQKLENISLALNFLENEEHIKIVNIGWSFTSIFLLIINIISMRARFGEHESTS